MKKTGDQPEWPDILRCHDCSQYAGTYMVRNEVWDAAWPEYAALKAANRRKHFVMCRTCLEARLGRHLTVADFDLSIPINSEIQFGHRLGAVMVAAASREIDALIEGKDGRAMAAWFAANQNSVLHLSDAARFFEAFEASGVTEDDVRSAGIEIPSPNLDEVKALVNHGLFTSAEVAKYRRACETVREQLDNDAIAREDAELDEKFKDGEPDE